MVMSKTIKYATFRGSPNGDIIPGETTRPALTGDEVLVSVAASGLCSGDMIFKKNDVSSRLIEDAYSRVRS